MATTIGNFTKFPIGNSIWSNIFPFQSIWEWDGNSYSHGNFAIPATSKWDKCLQMDIWCEYVRFKIISWGASLPDPLRSLSSLAFLFVAIFSPLNKITLENFTTKSKTTSKSFNYKSTRTIWFSKIFIFSKLTKYFLAKLPPKLIIAPATFQGNTVYPNYCINV